MKQFTKNANIKVILSYFSTFMTFKISKTTSKGQITLPSKWRKQFNTNNFILQMDSKQITIKPLLITEEEVIFDAETDNINKSNSNRSQQSTRN